MSSLLSKLKTLIGASARGPRRYAKDPDASRPGPSVAPPPEVTDARTDQDDTPEATEATHVRATRPREVSGSPRTSRIEEPEPKAEQIEELEDDKIVDLLKGKQN